MQAFQDAFLYMDFGCARDDLDAGIEPGDGVRRG